MTAREIAEKYVYGKHNALTDKQEIKDMIKDIDTYAKAINKNSVIPNVSVCTDENDCECERKHGGTKSDCIMSKKV